MGKEIERKFIVTADAYKAMATGSVRIIQGYLSVRPEATVRVRIAADKAWLTVKGVTRGAVRDEWEYEIPPTDARQMLESARCAVIDKTRHIVPFGGRRWEVDEFHGALAGLTVAEVELPEADAPVALPPFVGEEVTGNPAYYNSQLVSRVESAQSE